MLREIKIKLKKLASFLSTSTFVFLLVMPASTNYQLKDFGFGSGGTSTASSGNYSLDAIAGEISSGKLSSATFGIGSGLTYTNQANVPVAPTFTNPNNYYNKLQLIIDTSGNPADTKFAIAISTDNFATITNYVQSDNTVGTVLGIEDYQAYASWGGASGFYVIGLAANTTYQVKVKAMQGKFTETGFGLVSTAATVNPTMSFGININTINFGNLPAGTVVNSPQSVTASFATNGETGGKVYIIGKNAGLLSASKSYTIASATADLSSAAVQGFGAQGTSATQSSGGPLSIVAPYNVAASNVGIVDTAVREIFSSANPIVGGSGIFLLKAKSLALTPAASDYSEILTVIASGSF
ncbi:MAG: hypothetical protein HGA36_01215 [Candidatus Moranbacteria bacterium]|nr:hypothetical protein [Candidatus Moranbacteria bacterium]